MTDHRVTKGKTTGKRLPKSYPPSGGVWPGVLNGIDSLVMIEETITKEDDDND